jgi:hypothetical protein
LTVLNAFTSVRFVSEEIWKEVNRVLEGLAKPNHMCLHGADDRLEVVIPVKLAAGRELEWFAFVLQEPRLPAIHQVGGPYMRSHVQRAAKSLKLPKMRVVSMGRRNTQLRPTFIENKS